MTAKNDNAELQQFYYHPDHLGSSSYISNLDGEVVQHVEYVPFGEVFLEEKNAKWNTPYLFTSKELDRETGMYYFGARYQDPKLGIFISVDPLAEKFKGVSSYAYTLNNPVRFTDPDGKAPNDIILWGYDTKLKEYRPTVVVKSSLYNIDYYSKNIAAPSAPTSQSKGEPTVIYGLDLWATLTGKPDAVRFNMAAELHAGGVNIGGTLGIVAPLQGVDKGGLFFYRPSTEKSWDIGFEKASYSLEIGAGLGISLIYNSTSSYADFNRKTFEGLESSIGGNYGIFNASLLTASDGSYTGVSVGFGMSHDFFDGKRDNKSIGLSGAKLIETLSIEPQPKK